MCIGVIAAGKLAHDVEGRKLQRQKVAGDEGGRSVGETAGVGMQEEKQGKAKLAEREKHLLRRFTLSSCCTVTLAAALAGGGCLMNGIECALCRLRAITLKLFTRLDHTIGLIS